MTDSHVIKAKSGTNQEGASAHNRRVIIDALRMNGALSRADLARATRLTKQTISNLIEALELEGLVASEEVVRKGRGQPSTPYRLVPSGAFSIGLQIDRYLARAVAVDLIGNAVVEKETDLLPDDPERGVQIILSMIAELRKDLLKIEPISCDRIAGLGVAMPGPFGVPPNADNPWMMPTWQSFPLQKALSEGTGLEVTVQNDAAACAIAERMLGAANGLDDAVCIYLGYGIGAGLILGGELYTGAHGNAGEMGMALLSRDGNHSPLEHRASMASLYAHLDLDPGQPDINSKIVSLLENNDARIIDWITQAADDLRWAIHLVETIFDPQAVIISSGAPEVLARKLIAAIEPLLPSNSLRPDRKMARLLPGMFDLRAVARGAAVEPIGRAFEPRFAAILKD